MKIQRPNGLSYPIDYYYFLLIASFSVLYPIPNYFPLLSSSLSSHTAVVLITYIPFKNNINNACMYV